MMGFESFPIKRKLTAAMMLTSTVALILTCAAFIIYEIIVSRDALVQHLSTLARVTAENSNATLAFQDERDATDVLAALKAERNIVEAALYNQENRIFATYRGPESKATFPTTPAGPSYLFERGYLIIFEPVQDETGKLGTLYIKASLTSLTARIRLYLIIGGFFLAGSVIVAFGLATALQKRIAGPILTLAETARRVSDKQDYSVRARVMGGDELGELTDAFNLMLDQIQQRDVQLSDSEQRLRLALTASKIGVWEWDITTGTSKRDDYTYELFGRKRGDMGETPAAFYEVVHPQDRPWLQASIERAIQFKTDFIAEFRVIWPDQSVHYLASRGRVLEHLKPVRMVGVSIDITESKQSERVLRESEEKYRRLSEELDQRVRERTAELAASNTELEAFTYSVSHDLRAPLRHINAYAQVLQEDFSKQLAPEAVRYLNRIRDGTKNMGVLVDDLLNLARVGKQELNFRLVPLGTIVDEVVQAVRPETQNRNITWHVGVLPCAECDPGLMKQVFANLVSNAVKYSRIRAQAVIEIDQTTIDGQPTIFVRDNGVGFDMKYIDKIFGPFQRLHRAEDFEGTGVGLATVWRIMQKHHGRIWAQAEVDKGATFFLTFPGIKPAVNPRRLPDEPAAAKFPTTS